MKYFSVAVGLVFLLLTVISCKKTSGQNSLLAGKWNLIDDSSSTDNSCTDCFNGSKYIGKESDYYDFTNNGALYIEERGAADTATYTILANNQVTITTDYAVNGGGVFISSLSGTLLPLSYSIKNLTYTITNLTEHTLTLTTSGTATLTGSGEPPIIYVEIINLKR